MKLSIRDLTLCAMFVALIAVCSWITVPAAVPFTLQTFAVFLACALLGWKAELSIIVYLALGAIGVPVFAGFAGGIGAILGSTGGYLIGFLLAPPIIAPIAARSHAIAARLAGQADPASPRMPLRASIEIAVNIIAMLIALGAIYACGTAWFMYVYSRANGAIALATVLGWCVIPFVPFDVMKLALAAILARRLKRARVSV